jgi:hypothetical protein
MRDDFNVRFNNVLDELTLHYFHQIYQKSCQIDQSQILININILYLLKQVRACVCDINYINYCVIYITMTMLFMTGDHAVVFLIFSKKWHLF